MKRNRKMYSLDGRVYCAACGVGQAMKADNIRRIRRAAELATAHCCKCGVAASSKRHGVFNPVRWVTTAAGE